MAIIEFIFHFDQWLQGMISTYPVWIYVIIALIVYAETAFFPVAPFLPGDGLLFAIGVVAAGGALNLWIVIPLLALAGILGNYTAYYMGDRYGEMIFQKIPSIKEEHIQQTHEFYRKHGSMTFIFSRFLPVVRALVPLIAGIAKMSALRFWRNNIGSVTIWVVSLILLGYQLGNVPFVRKYFGWIIVMVSVVSLGSIVYMSLKRYITAEK